MPFQTFPSQNDFFKIKIHHGAEVILESRFHTTNCNWLTQVEAAITTHFRSPTPTEQSFERALKSAKGTL